MTLWQFQDGAIQIRKQLNPYGYEMVTGPRAGEMVEGVTSATNYLGDSEGLKWFSAHRTADYWRDQIKPGVAYDEIVLDEINKSSRSAHKRASDRAMGIGNLVHNWIEAWVRTDKDVPLPINEQARKGCAAFQKWADKVHLQPLMSEVVVYSSIFDYAGTIDLLARVEGRLAIVDFKAAAKVYPAYRLQITAYLKALYDDKESRLMMRDRSGYTIPDRYIVRLDKKTGRPHPLKLEHETLQADYEAFISTLNAYRWAKSLTNSKPKNSGKA